MKVLVSPGAFKNSLKAIEAADCIVAGLERSGLQAELVRRPIADGGNGTLDVMLAATPNSNRTTITVRNPFGRPVKADYGLIDNGQTAIIEMALASGLEVIGREKPNPMKASSYGTGQLMAHALAAGARKFIIGLGGSATVEGGYGLLMALGARYFDANQRPILQQGGAALGKVRRVDLSGIDPRWADCEILVAVDVENPPFGQQGAAAVFGPQKGATEADVTVLDEGLRHFMTALTAATGRGVGELVGGGAAGAMSAGLVAALGAKLVPGIETVLSYIGFDEALAGASLVVTGEGRMDEQTISGKGPFGVALRAKSLGIPTVALVGSLGVDDAVLHDAGLAATFSILDKPIPLEIALRDAAELLERAALRLGYMLQVKL